MSMRRPIRIGNASGFYGDRVEAALEMVTGGDIDVLTGDYLAELTMFLLHKARTRDPEAGYASTFLTQLEQVLTLCVERGIKIVANAGGLNPSGLASRIRELAARLDVEVSVAYVDGDDVRGVLETRLKDGDPLRHLDSGAPLIPGSVDIVTANAYLGAWPIVEALKGGADIVVTGRVTDASLAVAPAAWWHDWARDDWDRLAGAVAAGHVIECGPQATGGNYAFFTEITDTRYPGFPIAEIADDGSSVITKHDDTGGLVDVGTVTAQLLYEIGAPAYGGPDVTAWFDTIDIAQEGQHRVRLSGTRGTPPTGMLKVAINFLGGYRNTMTAVITGLDIPAKARRAEEIVWSRLGGKETFDSTDVQLWRFDRPHADTQAEAVAQLAITVKDKDPAKVGRKFSAAVMELFLGGYPGFHATTPPSRETAYGVYWPTLIPADSVRAVTHFPDGKDIDVPATPGDEGAALASPGPVATPTVESFSQERTTVPLGTLFGARSGDKGGNANLGIWARSDLAYSWLVAHLSPDTLRALLPETANLEIRRYELPNLRAVNFVIVGLLGEGVASSVRMDAQAKALGEFVRSRLVDVPRELLEL